MADASSFLASARTRIVSSAVLVGIVAVVLLNAETLALGSVHLYQQHLSPVAARLGMRCRFTPTCSRYAEIVIARDGVIRGGWETLTRIARCGPWTPPGTKDEP